MDNYIQIDEGTSNVTVSVIIEIEERLTEAQYLRIAITQLQDQLSKVNLRTFITSHNV